MSIQNVHLTITQKKKKLDNNETNNVKEEIS